MNKQSQRYFQSQRKLSSSCGVCAINNFLGDCKFSDHDMKNICYSLSDKMINPYKSVFGGDFDVSVLIIALQRQGYDLEWVKQDADLIQIMQSTNFCGFLINEERKRNIWHRVLDQSARHWVCIKPDPKKRSQQKYLSYDSEQKSPTQYKATRLKQLLHQFLINKKGTLLQIIKKPS